MQTLLQTGNTWKARARSHADGLADGADDSSADRRFFRGRFMPTRARTPAQEKPGSRAGQENSGKTRIQFGTYGG